MKFFPRRAANPLLEEAKKLAREGYSVIPAHGNNAPDEPKKPAIKWRQFQQRIPAPAELEAAFDPRFSALGIVCGRVSQLVVIDFDDHLRYRRFCMHLPQYAETYTVKTRRGCHLYFRTSELVPSHQFAGGDIKGERSYVIAPPSLLGDFRYQAVNDLAPLQLEAADIDKLLNYLHVKDAQHVSPGRRIRERRDIDFAALYRGLAVKLGRNNALYRTASIAREQGMTEGEAQRILAPLHARQPAQPGHRRESAGQRILEAQRSIRSAFSAATVWQGDGEGIPNSVRERLLAAQKSSIMPRLLDALRLAGWQQDAFFTMGEAVVVARRVGLSRKAVLQALTGELSIHNGRHIISRRYAEYLDSGGLKSRGRGRPVRLMFQVPSVGRLLAVLNARWSPSDPIRQADLRRASSYRQALHRGYIQRVNPRATMASLGGRIGVSARTLRRYNRQLQIKATACLSRLALTRESLRSLPRQKRELRKNATAGYWLETAAGARLPAWRHVGAMLLKQAGAGTWLCMRRPSRYSLDDDAPPVEYAPMTAAEFTQLRQWRGETIEAPSLRERAGQLLRKTKAALQSVTVERLRLTFDSVAQRIAEDKVAETISGYLYAQTADGAQVRRPARRGIAYRMLKEFGDGNVFLALREGAGESLLSLARRALGGGADDADDAGGLAAALAPG